MDFDDIEISYIGEEEAIDDADNNEDLNEDFEVWGSKKEVRVVFPSDSLEV